VAVAPTKSRTRLTKILLTCASLTNILVMHEAITADPGTTLAAALLQAQRSIRPVVKAGYNSFGKYHFTRSEDMIAEGRAALNAAGLTLSLYSSSVRHEEIPGERPDTRRIILFLRTKWLLRHENGGFAVIKIKRPIEEPQRGALDKAVAATSTFNLAYAIRDILQIDRRLEGEIGPDEDDRSQSVEPLPSLAVRERPPAPPKAHSRDSVADLECRLSRAADAAEIERLGSETRTLQPSKEEIARLKVAAQCRHIDLCNTLPELVKRVAKIQGDLRMSGPEFEAVKAHYESRRATLEATEGTEVPF